MTALPPGRITVNEHGTLITVGICPYCGSEFTVLMVDHARPLWPEWRPNWDSGPPETADC